MKNPEKRNMTEKRADPAVWPVMGLGTKVDIMVAKLVPAINIVNTTNI